MTVTGKTVRIEADAAGAFPASSGLTRFHRVFLFDGAGTFTVEDTVATLAAKPIQWFLHSDVPITASAGTFRLGGMAPSLSAAFTAPAGSTTAVEKTLLVAPGKPGSINEGPEEQRGYHVKLETPAATATKVRIELRVIK